MSLCLVLMDSGGAQLERGSEVLWASTDDDKFRDTHPDELLQEDDVADILNYLVATSYLTIEQADNVEVFYERDGEEQEAELNGEDFDCCEDDDWDCDESEDDASD